MHSLKVVDGFLKILHCHHKQLLVDCIVFMYISYLLSVALADSAKYIMDVG